MRLTERGIRLSAIADRVRQRRNRVQLGYAFGISEFRRPLSPPSIYYKNIKKDNRLKLSYVWRRVSNVNRIVSSFISFTVIINKFCHYNHFIFIAKILAELQVTITFRL